MLNLGRVRQIGRIRQLDHSAVGLKHFIDHPRSHQIQIIFSLQAFLNDLQMQKPQKTTAKAKAKRHGGLRLIIQRSVV